MPHQLVLKYLSSKTYFVFNQTLFTLFRERYAMLIPLTAKFYLVNPSNLVKTEKTHGTDYDQNNR